MIYFFATDDGAFTAQKDGVLLQRVKSEQQIPSLRCGMTTKTTGNRRFPSGMTKREAIAKSKYGRWLFCRLAEGGWDEGGA